MMRTPSVSGRGWAYIGAALGGTVSIAANVAHSYVPPTGAPAAWAPQPGAVVGAIFWPVALFVVTEILARVVWPAGRRWIALRFAGLLPVALVAALVSYKHLAGLLRFYGEDSVTSHLGPLAVDGLMVMATGALLATAGRVTALAGTPIPAGEPAPVSAEMTAPATPAVPADAVADAPAGGGAAAPIPPVTKMPAVTKVPVKRVMPRPASADKVARAAAKLPGASVAEIAARAGVSPSTVRRHLAAPRVTDASPSGPVTAQTPAPATAEAPALAAA